MADTKIRYEKKLRKPPAIADPPPLPPRTATAIGFWTYGSNLTANNLTNFIRVSNLMQLLYPYMILKKRNFMRKFSEENANC